MTKTFQTIGLTALLSISSSLALADDISYSQVVLRGLDKVTGRLSTMTVNVGEKTTFGALDIYTRVCYAHPPEETPENAAFLEVVEKKEEGQLKLFSGWMFSSSPALSAMDHAVYDVWVIKCQGDQVDPPAPEPLVLENPIAIKPVQPKLKIVWDEENQTITDVSDLSEEEKPIDPENQPENTQTESVSAEEMQETDSIVIHIEQPREQTSSVDADDGNTETDMEPQEFRLIPIQETMMPDSDAIPGENQSEAEPVIGSVGETEVGAEPVIEAVGETEVGAESVVESVGETEVGTESVVESVGETEVGTESVVESVGETEVGTESVVESVGETEIVPEKQEIEPEEDSAPLLPVPNILEDDFDDLPAQQGGLFSEESEMMEKAIFSTDEY